MFHLSSKNLNILCEKHNFYHKYSFFKSFKVKPRLNVAEKFYIKEGICVINMRYSITLSGKT